MTGRLRYRLVLGVLGVLSLASLALFATDPGAVFELDGNVAKTSSLSDDWNALNPTVSAGAHPDVSSFVAGNSPESIFTTGGSKDPLDVASWRWKAADTVPDKDTITNAYAAKYGNVFVFGAERFAVNGDSNIGLWFFQNDVSLNSDGTFKGVHVNGDIFAVSAFTGGGGNAEITLYKWDSSCNKGVKTPLAGDCAQANLRLMFDSGASSTCGNGSIACAITNSSPITNANWTYAAKFGGGQTMPVGAFFEGGLDAGALFPNGQVPCFANFLMETRSSQEPSAVLKDFVLGGFKTCSVAVSKQCDTSQILATSNPPTIQYNFSGIVTNTGSGTLYDVKVTDSFPANVTDIHIKCGSGLDSTTGECTFPSVGPGAANAATYTGSFRTPVTSGLVNQVDVKAAATSGGAQTVTSNATWPAQCSVSIPSGLTLEKQCAAALVQNPTTREMVVQVSITGKVCNTGTTPVTQLSVTDDVPLTGSPGLNSMTSLAASPANCVANGNCTCATFPTPLTYRPSSCVNNDGLCSFADNVSATGTAALAGPVSAGPTQATCRICPNGACSTLAP